MPTGAVKNSRATNWTDRRTRPSEAEPKMGDEQQDAANPQQEPDLMGYDNVETLVNAKRASDVEARRLFEENARLKAILEVQAANPRPEVRNRYEEELANAGVPVDP